MKKKKPTILTLNKSEDVIKYLFKAGIADKTEAPVVEALSGGVSSSVWKVALNKNRWVMKQALDKLKVEADWFSDIERIHREHEVMEALDDLVPAGSIPKVLHVDYINHIYMMNSAEEGAETWKDHLMKGNFNSELAEEAAYLLREIHAHSNSMDPEDKEKFQDQKYFIQLRIDPFHRYLMEKYPELSEEIQKLIDELTLEKNCLVHGDFSPKNMLVEKDNKIVLIDFEVAHWGNPVFDLAYCIGHLMLKGWHLKKRKEAFKLIEVFIKEYDRKVDNLVPHLGLMLLARMDGKSKVPYITDKDLKHNIRKVAISWIKEAGKNPDPLSLIQKAFKIDLQKIAKAK